MANSNAAGVFAVRSLDDAFQFPMVQPIELAMLAILDDDVASAAIKMRIHFMVAPRALDAPVQLAPIRLMGRLSNNFAARA